MFSHSSDFTELPLRPHSLLRLGGPVQLREVIAQVLARQASVDLPAANPVDEPPPELPRAA